MKIIDLTHELYDNCPVFPGDPRVSVERVKTIKKNGCNLTKISAGAHSGTHIDAPFHFLENGAAVDKIKLDKLVGKALVVDLSRRKGNGDLTVKDFMPYSKKIIKGARILIRSGWHRNYGKKSFYTAYPGISRELARWLGSRKIALIGLEAPSVHAQDSSGVHKILLGSGIAVVESLANLDKIKKKEVFFIGLPLKIKGSEGSPIRAVALE